MGDFDVVTDRRAALVAFALGGAGRRGAGRAVLGVASRRRRHGPHGLGGHRGPAVLPALAEDPERHRAAVGRRGRRLRRVVRGAGRGMGQHRGAPRARPGRGARRRRPPRRCPRRRGVARRCTAPPCTAPRRACGWPPWPGARSRSATATSRGCGWRSRRPRPRVDLARGRRAHRSRGRRGTLGLRRRRRHHRGACHLAGRTRRARSSPSTCVDVVRAAPRPCSTPGPSGLGPLRRDAGAQAP